MKLKTFRLDFVDENGNILETNYNYFYTAGACKLFIPALLEVCLHPETNYSDFQMSFCDVMIKRRLKTVKINFTKI